MNITDLSIKRPLAVWMVYLGIIVFGLVSLTKLAIDLLPNMTFPVVLVMTTYSGAGPEEIETEVTEPLEKSLGMINNLDKITSSSSENLSMITLQFKWGTNLDAAASDIRDNLGIIVPYLPDDADQPMVLKLDPNMQPVIMYSLAGDIDPLALNDIGTDIADRLQRVGGVAASYNEGGTVREIQVILDPVKLNNTGITPDQIMDILQAQNVNYPLGSVEEDKKVYILRVVGQYDDLAEIRRTVVGNNNGIPILLSQVAGVRSRAAEQNVVSRINGSEAIWGYIQKRTDANTVNVCNNVVKEIDAIQSELPPGVKLDVVWNQSTYILKSVRSTADTLWMGAILAVIILFLFFGSLRSTIYVAISIPITVFFTLFLMFLFRMSLNIVSLGGLTIAIGMVVDCAIVVFEAIYRHQEKGEDPATAASRGTHEVGMAITASTLTTVAVFLPLLLVTGFASIFFSQLALTVTFALVSSLVVALTIIPMLTASFFNLKKQKPRLGFTNKLTNFYARIENVYAQIIHWALKHRRIVIWGTIGVFIVSLLLVLFIGSEFMPDMDQGEINITAEMPVGTKLAFTDSAVINLESLLLKEIPETEDLFTSIGTGSGFIALFTGSAGPHSANISISLVDREKRSRSIKQIQHDIRPKLNTIPGLKVSFATHMFSSMFGGGSPIEIKILGYDRNKTRSLSQKLMEKLADVKGLTDITSDLKEGKPEYQLRIDREKAARFGLTPYQVGALLRGRIAGVVASQFREKGKEYDIKIRLDKKYRDHLQKIRSMTITTPLGEVPLANFVKDTITTGPVTINHENIDRIIKITAGVEGRDLGSVANDVRRIMNAIPRTTDIKMELSGSFEQMQDTFRDFGLVILLAFFLVYIIMVGQFESFKEPFIIMFTIPLAIIGVLWMLFFTNTTINIQSLLGVLLLGGIVVNNAIVYIDYVNQLRRKQEYKLLDAVVEAGRVRLKPILMTALTTIFGLIPMALGMGSGNELRAGMARSVIGGLTVSTFLTLVFIPVLYVIFEQRKERTKATK